MNQCECVISDSSFRLHHSSFILSPRGGTDNHASVRSSKSRFDSWRGHCDWKRGEYRFRRTRLLNVAARLGGEGSSPSSSACQSPACTCGVTQNVAIARMCWRVWCSGSTRHCECRGEGSIPLLALCVCESLVGVTDRMAPCRGVGTGSTPVRGALCEELSGRTGERENGRDEDVCFFSFSHSIHLRFSGSFCRVCGRAAIAPDCRSGVSMRPTEVRVLPHPSLYEHDVDGRRLGCKPGYLQVRFLSCSLKRSEK
jgi:hypothetical protein